MGDKFGYLAVKDKNKSTTDKNQESDKECSDAIFHNAIVSKNPSFWNGFSISRLDGGDMWT